jgi:photosystem II stability/assembly factor-like uncharacterized protein
VGSEAVGIQRLESTANPPQWQNSGSGLTDLVRGLVISNEDPDLMYAATLSSGVFKSTNSGDNWTLSGLGDRRILHMDMNPQNNQEIYVGTTKGLAVTYDGGENWFELGQRVAFASAITHLPTNPESILIGGSGGFLYQTQDDGNTWKSIEAGLPTNELTALENGGTDGLFAGIELSGLYRSLDNGQSWSLISDTILANEKILSIAVETTFDQLFIATETNGLFSSNITGDSLSPITLPRANYTVDTLTQIALDLFNIDKLYVSRANQSGSEFSLHISEVRGSSWVTPDAASGLPPGSIFSVAASPHQTNQVLCGHKDGIYKSADGGLNWSAVNEANISAQKIDYDINHTTTVYAAPSTGGIIVSNDSGDNWTASDLPTSIIVSDISTGSKAGQVIASTFNRGMVLSTDYGKTWTQGLEASLTTPVVLYVVINPVNPKNIYLATTERGVLRSYDGGFTFDEINNGFGDHLSLLSLIIDPRDPDILYAGTVTGGVYMTENQGDTWIAINEGKYHELTIALEIDPVDHRKIYAGFEGGGVYRMQRSTKYLQPDSDHDLDGMPTIWEQYLNLDPLSAETNVNLTDLSFTDLLPTDLSRMDSSIESKNTTLRWLKGVNTPEEPVNASVEWSRNLKNWFPLGNVTGPVPYGSITEQGPIDNFIQMQASITDPELGKSLFLRLKFSR